MKAPMNIEFFKWFETVNNESSDDDYFRFYVLGDQSSDIYNYIEVIGNKVRIFFKNDYGLVKKWLEPRIKAELIKPLNYSVFDELDSKTKAGIIMSIFGNGKNIIYIK